MITLQKMSATAVAELRSAVQSVCSVLKTMANEDRLLLLSHMLEAERNVGELEALTGIRQPTLSQQLGVLRDEHMVYTRRVGKFVYYGIHQTQSLQLLQALHQIFCAQTLTPSTGQEHKPQLKN